MSYPTDPQSHPVVSTTAHLELETPSSSQPNTHPSVTTSHPIDTQSHSLASTAPHLELETPSSSQPTIPHPEQFHKSDFFTIPPLGVDPLDKNVFRHDWIDWKQLVGFELVEGYEGRSFIWRYGCKLRKEGVVHWLCRSCHEAAVNSKGASVSSPEKRLGQTHIYGLYMANGNLNHAKRHLQVDHETPEEPNAPRKKRFLYWPDYIDDYTYENGRIVRKRKLDGQPRIRKFNPSKYDNTMMSSGNKRHDGYQLHNVRKLQALFGDWIGTLDKDFAAKHDATSMSPELHKMVHHLQPATVCNFVLNKGSYGHTKFCACCLLGCEGSGPAEPEGLEAESLQDKNH